MRLTCFSVVLAAAFCTTAADAQPITVQLPTFTFTTVGTTVLVPDQGSAFLGGVSRAAEGASQFGVPGITFPGFQNRSIGSDQSATSFRVTATIHDFDAMDQALLNSPSLSGVAAGDPFRFRNMPQIAPAFADPAARPIPNNLAGNWDIQPDPPSSVSDVAAEQADRAARRRARAEESEGNFARGQQAEADGKPNVAKIYYQMALKHATGSLKLEAQARLDAVSGRTATLAKNTP